LQSQPVQEGSNGELFAISQQVGNRSLCVSLEKIKLKQVKKLLGLGKGIYNISVPWMVAVVSVWELGIITEEATPKVRMPTGFNQISNDTFFEGVSNLDRLRVIHL